MDDIWVIVAIFLLGLGAGYVLRDRQLPRRHRKLGK